jgi:hypothetical protein
MANRDPAFLWETEALRTSSSPAPEQGRSPVGDRPGNWMTLRQASDASGIPLSTLRNWARKGRVPTALEEFTHGTRRIVSLDAVRARARQLGQPVNEEPAVEPQKPSIVGQDQVPPPGTMLVPIAAWDKMLIQLGNLHQAGQELAEARERAARAETEASFLRERLAELRGATMAVEPEPVGPSPAPEPAAVIEARADSPRIPRFSAYLWRLAVSDRRRRGREAPST